MARAEKASDELLAGEEEEEEKEEVDLFGNKRRKSLSVEGARRASLGLPDNGAGLTKDYYNIDRPMSVTSLVDLIVLRRTGNENRPRRRSTQLSQDLEERIKKTLAWKEMEDELNKEDVMVNFRKKMRELRKEARQMIPKESKIERKINEERRIQLRTSLLEPNNRRRPTTESVKEAIQEFKTRPPTIIDEDPKMLTDYEEDKEASDIIQKTRDLLEQLGYLKGKPMPKINEDPSSVSRLDMRGAAADVNSVDSEPTPPKRRKKSSQSGSERSLTANVKSKPKSRTSYDQIRKKSSQRTSTAPSSSSRGPSASAGSRKSDVRTPVRPPPSRQPPSQTKRISSGQIRSPLSQRT